jgi:hypothetical protein
MAAVPEALAPYVTSLVAYDSDLGDPAEHLAARGVPIPPRPRGRRRGTVRA